mmetsp:Transcript_102656/g.244696  ORF Transcript_102656/g.244696 Transcript_102656/m.244696 type:complete len:274 (-) Transcript_102656:264-1085(-)
MLNLDLKSRFHPRRLDSLCNLTKEGRIASGMHQASGIALEHRCSKEGQVACFGWWTGDRLRLGVPWLRHRLPGQGRVVHLGPVGAVQDAHVRRDPIAGLEEDDVARDQMQRIHLQVHAAAFVDAYSWHLGSGLQFLHGFHLGLGLELRVPLEQSCHDDDRRKDDGCDVVGALFAVRRQCLRSCGGIEARCLCTARLPREYENQSDLSSNTGPQEDVENAHKRLPQQLDPDVFPLWRGDLVFAIHIEVDARLLLLQATEPRLARTLTQFALENS